MSQRAIIFADGDPASYERLVWAAWYVPGDLLVGADHGATYFARFGVLPHIVVGDFDSLAADALAAFEAAGVQVERHPLRKDQTDLELAVDLALAAGVGDILIFGALGRRWDMTLANMLLLARPAYVGVRLRLVDGNQQIMLIAPRRVTKVPGRPGDTVSLVPLGGDAGGVTTACLEYPLEAGTLPFGATLGISNVITTTPATLTVQSGLVMCITTHS